MRISPEEQGQRLDYWLAQRFTYQSRSQWQRAIKQGRIHVNRRRPGKNALPIHSGDVIAYLPPEKAEPPVDFTWSILLEDEHLLAVNKSGNLPCHPGGPFFMHTLWTDVRRQFPSSHPVHRIDRETSGVVLFAKTKKAASNLGRQFAEHRIRKEYLAVVEGCSPAILHGRGHLAAETTSKIRKKRRFFPDPTVTPEHPGFADTEILLLDQSADCSLLRVLPQTGRLHQIRATLLALGFPLVGDKLYGLDETCYLRFIRDELTDTDRRALRLSRQALHAWRLAFIHPISQARILVEAPLPEDMRNLLNQQKMQIPSSTAGENSHTTD